MFRPLLWLGWCGWERLIPLLYGSSSLPCSRPELPYVSNVHRLGVWGLVTMVTWMKLCWKTCRMRRKDMNSKRMKWKMLPSFSWKKKMNEDEVFPAIQLIPRSPVWKKCPSEFTVAFMFVSVMFWCFSYMSVCTWRRRIALLFMVRVLIAYLVSPVPSLRAGVPPAVFVMFYTMFLK